MATRVDTNGTSPYFTKNSLDALNFAFVESKKSQPNHDDDSLLAQVFSSVQLMDVKYTHTGTSPTSSIVEEKHATPPTPPASLTPDDDDTEGQRREAEVLNALDTALRGASDNATTTDESSDAPSPLGDQELYDTGLMQKLPANRRMICEGEKPAIIEDNEPFIIIGDNLTEDADSVEPENNQQTSVAANIKATEPIESVAYTLRLDTLIKNTQVPSKKTPYQLINDSYVDVSDVLRLQLRNAKSVGNEDGIEYLNPPFQLNDVDEEMERFTVGGKMTESEDDKVLILFGTRRAGKTSLVTTIINHLYDVKKEHEFRLCIDDPREIQATNALTEYTFNNTVYPFRVTVIDTPGVSPFPGDNNEETSEIIRHWFHNKLKADGEFRLDAIILVVNGQQNSIDAQTINQLNFVKEIFGSELKLNLLPVVTFSEALAQTPAIINSLIAAKTHFPRYFTVQNDSVLPLNAKGNALRHSLNFKHTDVSLESLFLYLHNTVQPLLAVAKKRDYYSRTPI